MKKCTLNMLAASLCILLLVSPAFGSETALPEICATPYVGNIYIEGKSVGCWDEAGNMLHFLNYDGIVYVSLWTAGQWMGADTLWDEEKQTISIITDQQEPAFLTIVDNQGVQRSSTSGLVEQAGKDDEVRASCLDAIIYLDDEKIHFTNAQGGAVTPLLYNGIVYLPVRGVGELMGMRVLWRVGDQGESNIYLYAPPTSKQYQEAIAYYIQVWQYTEKLKAMLLTLENDKNLAEMGLQDNAVQERLVELKTMASSILALTPPTSHAFSVMADNLNLMVGYLIDVDLARYINADIYMHSRYVDLGWDWHSKHFLCTIWNDCEQLDKELENLRSQILAVEKLEAARNTRASTIY